MLTNFYPEIYRQLYVECKGGKIEKEKREEEDNDENRNKGKHGRKEQAARKKRRMDRWKEEFIERLPSCSVIIVNDCVTANNPRGYDKPSSICRIAFN